MTRPDALRADVEAALQRLAEVEAAGTKSGTWQVDGPWWHNDDELGNLDNTSMVSGAPDRKPLLVTSARDINWRSDDRNADVAKAAGAVRALPAALTMVRLVLRAHVPELCGFLCEQCWDEWLCPWMRAAAQVVGVPVEQP